MKSGTIGKGAWHSNSEGPDAVTHVLCRLTGHRRDSRRVWNDQVDFRSRCKRCGIDMVRDLHGWRAFDPERDADPHRTTRHDDA